MMDNELRGDREDVFEKEQRGVLDRRASANFHFITIQRL
jgi:hypothetical protein